MKIAEAQVTTQSNHFYSEKQVKEESLRIWLADQRPDFPENTSTEASLSVRDTVTISVEGQRPPAAAPRTESTSDLAPENGAVSEDPKLRTIRLIIEALTGRKIDVANISKFQPDPPELEQTGTASPQDGPQREGWGVEYDSYEEYSESEEMNFSSSGTIKTADGQQFAFSVQLNLSRKFSESSATQIRLGDARLVDPLVINFEGTAAQLSDSKFNFDLDADGTNEAISHLQPGSGFLFIDKNNDGKASDGSELFGPRSGDGFAELSKYDLDNNNWIDENDPIYTKLRIWSKDNAGSDYFSSLTEKNIGAIYLNSLATEFSLNNQANLQQGKLQESSIFLKESGEAGTIQEILLTV